MGISRDDRVRCDTDADTIDKLDPDEVARCVAAMDIMAYVVADMPDRLPR